MKAMIYASALLTISGLLSLTSCKGEPRQPETFEPRTAPREGQLRMALQRGQEFLAARQQQDGSLVPEGIAAQLRLGVTALGASALDGEPRDRALRFLVSCQGEDGFIADRLPNHGWGGWEHAYATLALGSSPQTQEAFRRAVNWILKTQKADGSWSHGPQSLKPGFVQTGLHCAMIEGLLLARRRGMEIPQAVFRRARAFLVQQRVSDGGIRNHEFDTASYEITATAVAALEGMGESATLEFLTARSVEEFELPERTGGEECSCYNRGLRLFGLFWTLISYRRSADPELFQERYDVAVSRLLKVQAENGRWDGWYGPEYGTAMAILILRFANGASPL